LRKKKTLITKALDASNITKVFFKKIVLLLKSPLEHMNVYDKRYFISQVTTYSWVRDQHSSVLRT
jgi:hypothetical protein